MLGTPRWRFRARGSDARRGADDLHRPAAVAAGGWTTLVAAELVGALVGLGHVLNMAQQDIYPGMIFVGMLASACSALPPRWVLGGVERRALAWNAGGKGPWR